MNEAFNFVFCNKALKPHSNKALPSSHNHTHNRPDESNTARGYILSREISQRLRLNNLCVRWYSSLINLCISHSLCRSSK